MSFIVVFDDEQGVCMPYGFDDDCQGAIGGSSREVAMFESRKAARTAITISERYAKLCEAQGKPVSTDFTDSKKFIRILPLKAAKKG